MSVVVTQDSSYAKERVKWEAHHTEAGPPGRPYEYRPYPAMLFKAGRINQGPLGIVEEITVHSEDEARNMYSRGFHPSPLSAIEAVEGEQTEHAKLAAERAYDVKNRLSAAARAEVEAAEAAHGSEHLPAMPETPIVKRQAASEATLAKQKENQRAKVSLEGGI